MLWSAAKREALPKETDTHKLAQRQKQIDFGRNTLGYAAYIKAIPRHEACQIAVAVCFLMAEAELEVNCKAYKPCIPFN
jgi:Histone RNA hairpin-binding protein RNA-binding domain